MAADAAGRFAGGGNDSFDERRLVERARSDPDAFAVLYRHYLPRIHGFALRRTGSREIAEDVTAATFERALRNLDRFRWKGGGFGPWLFQIASNELVDHHRREARASTERLARLAASTPIVDLDGGVEGRLEELGRAADLDQLRAALNGLNERYQRAISLRYLAGLDHAAAAEALGVSKPVMAVTLHRAVAALRKALDVAPTPTPAMTPDPARPDQALSSP